MQNYLNQLLFWGVVLVLSQDRLGGVYSNLFIVPKEEYSHYSVHKIPQQIPSYSKIIHGVHKVSSCLSKSKGTDCICEHRRCLSACSQFTHLISDLYALPWQTTITTLSHCLLAQPCFPRVFTNVLAPLLAHIITRGIFKWQVIWTLSWRICLPYISLQMSKRQFSCSGRLGDQFRQICSPAFPTPGILQSNPVHIPSKSLYSEKEGSFSKCSSSTTNIHVKSHCETCYGSSGSNGGLLQVGTFSPNFSQVLYSPTKSSIGMEKRSMLFTWSSNAPIQSDKNFFVLVVPHCNSGKIFPSLHFGKFLQQMQIC